MSVNLTILSLPSGSLFRDGMGWVPYTYLLLPMFFIKLVIYPYPQLESNHPLDRREAGNLLPPYLQYSFAQGILILLLIPHSYSKSQDPQLGQGSPSVSNKRCDHGCLWSMTLYMLSFPVTPKSATALSKSSPKPKHHRPLKEVHQPPQILPSTPCQRPPQQPSDEMLAA